MIQERRFTIVDAMILVGAVAAGLGMARYPYGFLGQYLVPVRGDFRTVIASLTMASAIFYPVALAVTLACLALRLRHPRPRVRYVLRQPGTVGCLAATFSLCLAFISQIPLFFPVIIDPGYFQVAVSSACQMASRTAGVGVAAAWFVQAVSLHWKPDWSWVDRLGRMVAASWIVAPMLEAAGNWAG